MPSYEVRCDTCNATHHTDSGWLVTTIVKECPVCRDDVCPDCKDEHDKVCPEKEADEQIETQTKDT